MQFLGLRTTIYSVSDIEKAKEWYADLLEFSPYFIKPFYLSLKCRKLKWYE